MPLFSPVTKAEIIICRDVEALSRRAAEQFISLARAAMAAHGNFTVALSGGSTPKALYSLLATEEFSAQLDWRRIHLFFGDERCVAPDHAESNYRMVHESLLAKIAIPGANVHRLRGEDPPPLAAQAYEAELRRHFGAAALPRFDLALLGLGEDGHTASLFPGSLALNEVAGWVAAAYVEKLSAHRLTLTFPLFNNVAQVSFLVAGASKAGVLAAILQDSTADYPAARIKPNAGGLTWFVDHAAAEQLASPALN